MDFSLLEKSCDRSGWNSFCTAMCCRKVPCKLQDQAWGRLKSSQAKLRKTEGARRVDVPIVHMPGVAPATCSGWQWRLTYSKIRRRVHLFREPSIRLHPLASLVLLVGLLAVFHTLRAFSARSEKIRFHF